MKWTGGVWVRILVGFALGFFAGVAAEYLIRPGSAVGLLAVLGVAAAIIGGVIAALLPEYFTRDREHRQFLREHADLLRVQVYVPLLSTGTTIYGEQLAIPGTVLDLQFSGGPDWGYRGSQGPVSLTEFSNWNLGKALIESDTTLSSSFNRVWQRLEDRVRRKEKLDQLYLRKVTDELEAVFGPGFPIASNLTVPELPRWFNAAVAVNWVRCGELGYQFTEQISGNQHRIIGGGMIVLTSDGPFAVPVEDFAKVIGRCLNDSGLRSAWTAWLVENAEDQSALDEFLRAVKLAGERIEATHHINGSCEVCSHVLD